MYTRVGLLHVTELWLVFGTFGTFRTIPAHAVAQAFGEDMSRSLFVKVTVSLAVTLFQYLMEGERRLHGIHQR